MEAVPVPKTVPNISGFCFWGASNTSYIEADIFEMFVIDGQINLCRVAEFVMHRYVASDDRPRCQMDGVGESVVGVQIFDTQPTI